MTGAIRCYFNTINLKQFDYCTTYSFKVLVSEQKYKNNIKNREFQKKNNYNSHIYNVYVMFYYKIQWFYQDLKIENLCFFKPLLSSHTENIGPVPIDHVKSS